MDTMKAVVFRGINNLRVEEVAKPSPRAGEAVIRITATTICGTDVHIVKGEYPVKEGLILGHEPVGVIDALGEGLEDEFGRTTRDRRRDHTVRAVLLLPECRSLAVWRRARRVAIRQHDQRRVGRVPPRARTPGQTWRSSPTGSTDEQVLMLPDIASTGISGAESGEVRTGDAVAVFAQGPIGLCATLGARLRGASLIVGVDPVEGRREISRMFGASCTLDPSKR